MDSPIPLEALASLEVAKLFWNVSFTPDVLNLSNIKCDLEKTWEIKLTDYREKAIGKLNSFIERNEVPSLLKSVLRKSIFSLHEAYHRLVLWKITYDSLNKIDVFIKGELYAPNYFCVNGDFDHYIWTKRFVRNKNYPKLERFCLASCYWLENECEMLWTEMKNSDNRTLGGNFETFSYFGETLGITSLMVLHLDFPMTASERDWRNAVNFWKIAFEYAAEMGYEHAVYFIWHSMSESEKVNIIEDESFFEIISKCIEFQNDKMCYFFFSLLSEERQHDLIDWCTLNDRFQIWHILLIYPYGKDDFSNVLKVYYRIPKEIELDLIKYLVHRIKHHYLPLEIKIFQLLWDNLTQAEKQHILESDKLVKILAKRKSLCTLGKIIKSLSLEQKEKCLLYDCYGAGVNVLHIFSEVGEFNFLREYLGFFLIEIDSCTLKETICKDAVSILQKFIESSDFINWCKERLTKRQEIQIMNEMKVLLRSII